MPERLGEGLEIYSTWNLVIHSTMVANTEQSAVISKVAFRVNSTLDRLWLQAHQVYLGHHWDFLWFCNRVSHCKNWISNPCPSKSLSRWLCCANWGHVSLRGNWDYVSKTRHSLPGWFFIRQFISSEGGSGQALPRNSIRSCSRLSRSYLDHDFRRQIFLFSIFQEAHQPRNRNSCILLDRGDHHLAVMAIHGFWAAHFVLAPRREHR